MYKLPHIETRAWVAAANLPIQLKTLPARHYCRNILIHVNLSGTKTTQEAFPDPDIWGAAIQNIRIADYVNISGYDLDTLYTYVNGKRIETRTGPTDAATTFDVHFDLLIPFSDHRMENPDDSALMCEQLQDYSLEILTAAAGIFGGTIVITAGSFKISAEIVSTDSVKVPTVRKISFVDPGGQTVRLDNGAYTDAFFTETDFTDFAVTDITNVDVTIDGEAIVTNMSPYQLVSRWNSQTAYEEDPGINWAGPVVPVINISKQNNLITKVPGTNDGSAQIQIQGTNTEPHLVYWKAIYKDENTVAEIGRRQGLRNPMDEAYEARPAGGALETEPETPKFRKKMGLLPGKFVHPKVLARRASGLGK